MALGAYYSDRPPGAVARYARVVGAIGQPLAARSLGLAVGANPLVLAILCHRGKAENSADTTGGKLGNRRCTRGRPRGTNSIGRVLSDLSGPGNWQ